MAPKRKRLEQAEADLKVLMANLAEKRAKLNVVLTQFQALKDNYTSKTTKKQVNFITNFSDYI